MPTLSLETSPPTNLRMSLSGGHASKAWFRSICDLAETTTPVMAIDSSALVGQNLFDTHREDYTAAFQRHGFPDPIWLQDKPDALLDQRNVARTLPAIDVLMVLGGSTDLLRKRWQQAEVTQAITEAVLSGSVVACGQSAGAMIWFTSGHSDSDMFVTPEDEPWDYRMVAGTGVLPSWVTAHYSDTDSFGRLRSAGFQDSLRAHDGEWETALGIDSSATLYITAGAMAVRNINPIGQDNPAQVHLFSAGNDKRVLQDGDSVQLSALYS